MATITVHNQAGLLAALKTATGGDTILLADGHYGDVDLKNDYTTNLTIKAENVLGAAFTRLGLVGATNITLDGIQFETGLAVKDYSKGISVLNCDIDGNFYTRNVDGLVVDNVDVSGGQFGLLLNSVQNFSVTNSYIHDSIEDLMRITGDSYNGLVENNVISNTTGGWPLHPDVIQMFAARGVTPHDIIIRGNLLSDEKNTGETSAQGIFMSDPSTGGYKNILIEENLIRVPSPNTIYINGGQENVIVQNNTLMAVAGGGAGIVRLASKSGMDNSGTTVSGNVVKSVVDETKSSSVFDNYIYGKDADLSTIFSGASGSSWESYLPPEGSSIDFGKGYGAQARLLELLKEHAALNPPFEGSPEPEAEAPLPDLPVDTLPTEPETVIPTAPVEPEAAAPTEAYTHDKTVQLTGKGGHFVTVAHSEKMAIDEGAISLTFNADVTGWKRGLISKDTAGTGDAISAWIDNGTLIVRFQDGENTVEFSQAGIKTHQDYKLLITFDEEKVKVWLDDSLIGEAAMDVDLSENSDSLLIGAFNGKSGVGTTNNVQYFFDGTLSDIAIFDKALTPAELAALDDSTHASLISGLADSHMVPSLL